MVPGRAAQTDVWRVADALAFNRLIARTDAHAKNYSLLLSGTSARLAPLYDVASWLPYDDSDGHNVKLAMKLGAEYRLRATDRRSAWERTAADLILPADALIACMHQLTSSVVTAFEGVVGEPAVAEVRSDLPERLLESVAARAARCERLLE